MESWHWALLLRPFVLVAFLLVTGALVVYPMRRLLPEGRIKRVLLWKTNRATGWKILIPWLALAGVLAYITWATGTVY